MIKKPIVGAVAVGIIILCAFYIGTSMKSYGWLKFQTAASLNSQLPTSSQTVKSSVPSAQELYSIIKSLNNQIEKTSSGTEVAEKQAIQKVTQPGATFDAVKTNTETPTGSTKTDSLVKGVKTERVVDQEKLHKELIQRKNLLIMLAKADPRLFLLSALPASTKTKIPSALRTDLEESINITGKIEAIYFDDFENHKNSHTDYFLVFGNQKFSLYPTDDLKVLSSGVFRISGKKIGNLIVVDSGGIQNPLNLGGPDGPTPPPDSVGEQKTLVLLIRFQDSPPPPMSQDEAHNLIFNGQFQKFYREQSYNKTYFSGNVFGWYTLPGTCHSVNIPPDGNELENIIIDNQIHLSTYDRIILAIDGACFGAHSTIGKVDLAIQNVDYHVSVAWIRTTESTLREQYTGQSSTSQPFDWTEFDNLLSHEMGHSLGVMHSNGWDCGENILYGDCQHYEYGNLFDTMGEASFSLHFNSFYKEMLGWVAPRNLLNITTSGRYTINTLESITVNSAKQIAKIKIRGFPVTPFYLEYRKGIGFDRKISDDNTASNQHGLFVNRIINAFPGPFPRLLDIQPTTLGWYDDLFHSTLNVASINGDRRIFDDPPRGITIGPIINTSTSTITFDVKIKDPICVRGNPLESVLSPYWVFIGSNTEVPVRYGNGDSISCGNSSFIISTDIPSSWNPEIIPSGAVVIPSNDEQITDHEKTINFHIPTTTTSGSLHHFNARVRNITTGYETNSPIDLLALIQGVILGVNPGSGPVGTHLLLHGSNFAPQVSVSLNSSEGYWYINGIQSNGSTVEFDFPPQIYSYNCPQGQCSMINTPPGIYDVTVHSYNYPSNSVTFEVTQ